MASVQLNRQQWVKQWRTLSCVLVVIGFVLIAAISLMRGGTPRPHPSDNKPVDLTGIVDESFSSDNTDSAMTAQQGELEQLKEQMASLKDMLTSLKDEQHKAASSMVAHNVKAALVTQQASPPPENNEHTSADTAPPMRFSQPLKLHAVRFNYRKKMPHPTHRLSPDWYVPSGTFVRAVVLGGADADASVNGQSRNNGVMLFKLLQPGTLPNGSHSHLQGCFVTASAYGDISSERAYVALDKLSCAQPGQPIIDKAVQGWAFFNGKVGIKGMPLMRDNKVMQWAGISGMMSGIASAAQYAQSVQSIGQLGASSVVPSSNIAPYAAYGGASKAADVLSNYYVKRAEQYHPVIQVGSGNLVTIVFKDGFYLEPELDESRRQPTSPERRVKPARALSSEEDAPDFTVPEEVMAKIDQSRATTYHD